MRQPQPDITMPIGPRIKTYTCLMTQTGMNDPTVIVLLNQIGNIVWTRQINGSYIGTLTGAFTSDNITIFTGNQASQAWLAAGKNDNDSVYVETNNGTTQVDDSLYLTPVTINVYE